MLNSADGVWSPHDVTVTATGDLTATLISSASSSTFLSRLLSAAGSAFTRRCPVALNLPVATASRPASLRRNDVICSRRQETQFIGRK